MGVKELAPFALDVIYQRHNAAACCVRITRTVEFRSEKCIGLPPLSSTAIEVVLEWIDPCPTHVAVCRDIKIGVKKPRRPDNNSRVFSTCQDVRIIWIQIGLSAFLMPELHIMTKWIHPGDCNIRISVKIGNRVESVTRYPPLFRAMLHVMLDRVESGSRNVWISLEISFHIEHSTNGYLMNVLAGSV